MSIWVPVFVALIAAVPVLFSVRANRTSQKADTKVRETELAVNGLALLMRELRSALIDERKQNHECRQELARVRERLALVELELGLQEDEGAHGRRT